MALRLRKDGHSYEKIGALLGSQYHPKGDPFTMVYGRKVVLDAIKDIYREEAKHLISLEAERLDDMQLEALGVLRAEHVLVSGGAVVREVVLGDDGRPVINAVTGLPVSVPIRDDGPRLAAIDRLLKIQERRARLLGLDKPTKVAQTNPEGTKAAPTAVIMVSETDAKL